MDLNREGIEDHKIKNARTNNNNSVIITRKTFKMILLIKIVKIETLLQVERE